MLVVIMEIIDNVPYSCERKTVWILFRVSRHTTSLRANYWSYGSHDVPLIHVVNISPHSLQRDTSTRVVGNNLCNAVEVAVAISFLGQLAPGNQRRTAISPALMQTKSPVWHHSGQSRNL